MNSAPPVHPPAILSFVGFLIDYEAAYCVPEAGINYKRHGDLRRILANSAAMS
jgi:hypothetical protein